MTEEPPCQCCEVAGELNEACVRYEKALDMLERRGVITTAEENADACCGMPRDEDGFCTHRPGHPIFIRRNV